MTTLHGSAPSLRRRAEGCIPLEEAITSLGREDGWAEPSSSIRESVRMRVSDGGMRWDDFDGLRWRSTAKFRMPRSSDTRIGCPRIHLRLYNLVIRAHGLDEAQMIMELEALRQRPDETVTSFISRWREKIAQIIDRPSERDQISMIMKSLQPRFARHLMGFPHVDFGSLVQALYGIEEGIARGFWTYGVYYPPSPHVRYRSPVPFRPMSPTYLHSLHRYATRDHRGHCSLSSTRAPPAPRPMQLFQSGHDTDQPLLRHAIQGLDRSSAVNLGQPSVTTNPLPAHTTHSVPPPTGGIHHMDFVQDDVIHMLSWDDGLHRMIVRMMAMRVDMFAPFILWPEDVDVQVMTRSGRIAQATPPVTRPFGGTDSREEVRREDDEILRHQIRVETSTTPEALIHMMTADRATCIVFSADDLPPEGSDHTRPLYITVVLRAYDSTQREVMGTLTIDLLIGPTTFSILFQKVKFIHDGQVITVQSTRDMISSSEPVLQISHGEEDLLLTGFTFDEIQTLEIQDFCRDFVAMSFDQHSSTLVLDMMRGMSFLPGFGLGRRQHGSSEFVTSIDHETPYGLGFTPSEDDVCYMAQLRRDGVRARFLADYFVRGSEVQPRVEEIGVDDSTLGELQHVFHQMQLGDETPDMSASAMILPSSPDRASLFSLCFPDETTDYGVIIEPEDTTDGVVPRDEYHDEMDMLGIDRFLDLIRFNVLTAFGSLRQVKQMRKPKRSKVKKNRNVALQSSFALLEHFQDERLNFRFLGVKEARITLNDQYMVSSNFCMPYWIRDQEGRLVRIENPQDTELDICNSQQGQGGNPNAYLSMRDRMHPPRMSAPSCIIPPLEQLVIRPHIVPLLPNFHGMESENPYAHIKEFEEVCNTFREGGASIDLMRLKLFPFTLKDKAKIWLNSLRPRSIRNWVDLQAEFLKKFFPTHRTNGLNRQISNFSLKKMRSSMNVGKDFMSKNPEEAMDFLSYRLRCQEDGMSPTQERKEVSSQPTQNPKGGMYILSEDMDMKAKVATIARRLEELELKKMHEVQAISQTQAHAMPCTICQSCDHVVDECPTMPAVREMLGDQANVVGQFRPNNNAPYGNTYNSSWRNHPNFLGNQDHLHTNHKPKPKHLNNPLHGASHCEPKRKVSSQPSQNPKGVHEVETQEGSLQKSNNQEEKSGKKSASKSSIEEEPRIVIKEDMMKKHMPPPFPQALHGKKEIKNSSEILEVLRQVKVNIPLLDMIKQVPTYAKFLKDLCTVKRGLHVTKNAFLTEQYKDPGCPTILVNIGGTHVEKALLDLGASVNLLPYSVYKQLGLGGLKPTAITLSLADRSVKIPRGVIEDVLVQVDKFYYPVDFVVLDTDPILTFGNMTLELNIFHLCKRHLHPEEEEGLEEVCLINTLVEEHCDKNLQESLSESLEMFEEGLPEPSDVLAIMSPWRRRKRSYHAQPGKLIRSNCGGPSKACFEAASC
ncbi:hypothetical protein AAG906_015297 [Vitis piasezkii]